MSFFAYPPLGQEWEWSAEEAEKEAKALREEWTFKHVPSFELWCAVTCYDPETPDGGEIFQKMMLWALTANSGAGSLDPIHDGQKHFIPRVGYAGDMPNDTGGEVDYTITKSTNTAFVPYYAFMSQLKGGGTRSATSGYVGAWNPAREIRHLQSGNPYQPTGKVAWYRSAGMSTFFSEVTTSDDAATNEFRRFMGGWKDNHDANRGAKPVIGIRLAAFYGLYFYEDCGNPNYNWSSWGPTNVRMRLPNPGYTREKGKLWVEDSFLKFDGNKMVQHDDYKFEVPTIEKPSTCWSVLAWRERRKGAKSGDELSTVSLFPWAGSKAEPDGVKQGTEFNWPKAADEAKNMDAWVDKLKGTPWEGRMFERDDYGTDQQGRAFGWSFPKALWLYPHHGTQESTTKQKPHEKDYNMYQRWPEWRKEGHMPLNFTQIIQKKREALVDALELPPKDEAEWALTTGDVAKVSLRQFLGINSVVTQPIQTPAPQTTPGVATNKQKAVDVGADAEDEEDDEEQNLGEERGEDPENTETSNPDDGVTKSGALANAMGKNVLMDAGATEVDQLLKINEQTKSPLEPGKPNSKKRPDGNHHFFSDKFVPWSVHDVYEKPYHMFVSEKRMPRDEEQRYVDEYKDLYGSTANLFLRSEYPAKLGVTLEGDVDSRIGMVKVLNDYQIWDYTLDGRHRKVWKDGKYKKELFDANLTDETLAMFHMNLRRILSIYHDTSGPLGLAKTNEISVADKQRGMTEGMCIAKGKHTGHCAPVKYGSCEGTELLLPRVFQSVPPTYEEGVKPRDKYTVGDMMAALESIGKAPTKKKMKKPQLKVIFDREVPNIPINHLFAHNPFTTITGSLHRGDVPLPGTFTNQPVTIRSDMTVFEWLQTPWHYEYLPFQPMTSVFKDGETFCAGCTRCSRPYFEYEHMYSSYFLSVDRTAHWVFQYWRAGTIAADESVAPLPFHDGRFWSKNEVLSHLARVPKHGHVTQEDASGETPTVTSKGFHLWETREFLLKKPILDQEWKARSHLGHLKRETNPFTFRRYINHAWDEKGDYRPIVQGAVRWPTTKVCYGHRGYRLMRSIKFGNVCLDCASTLELAPGLYHRTGRVTASVGVAGTGRFEPGKVQYDTWWLGLKDAPLKSGFKFDPWFLYMQTQSIGKAWKKGEGGHRKNAAHRLGLVGPEHEAKRREIISFAKQKEKQYERAFAHLDQSWEEVLNEHLEAVEQYTRERNCRLLEYNSNKQATKVRKPPEVYIQKFWDRLPKDWKTNESAAMAQASKIIDRFKEFLSDSYEEKVRPEPFQLTWQEVQSCNRALRDALHDVHAMVGHMHAFRSEANPVFDPKMVRQEYRNVTINTPDGPVKNCLRVVQPVSAGYLIKTPTEPGDVPEAFVEGGKFIKRDYIPGTGTDWAGDDYVQKMPISDKVGHPTKYGVMQERQLTQSRVFITYSLHRAVKSELEARAVCEKMADAVRALFGQDTNLCRIVLLGVKLHKVPQDTISSRAYMPIEKANKAEKTFYGQKVNGVTDNSYMYDTYQTHIESVTVDAGVEIGPTYHHPHFHALVTLNHWTYVQIDTYRMKSILEQMFKGTHWFYNDTFMLLDGRGQPFYHDNENPYVDIRLYPTDNWADVIAAYVRKGSEKESILSLRARTGDT